MSLLLMSGILALLGNAVNVDDKYSLCNCEKLRQPIQMQLSKKLETFSGFFAPFLKSASPFEHLKNNIAVIAYVFPKLRTAKYVI